MDITITNSISPEEYLGLRQAVGWSVFPVEQAESGLQNSHVICFRDKEKAVALGRVIWDHGYSVLISDVIVAPEYQGVLGRWRPVFNSKALKKLRKQFLALPLLLGRKLMEAIMSYLRSLLKPGYRIMISLMAAENKQGFYKKFGFIERPSEFFGPGMHQWIEY